MKLHHSEEAGPPCTRMEPMLQRTADGTANWLTRAYALAHAAGCEHCGTYLHNLQAALGKLRDARREPIPEDAIDRLQRRATEIALGTRPETGEASDR